MATSGFKVKLDLSEFVSGVAEGGEKGVRNATEHLLTAANRSVPHDEGTLERSGEASVAREAKGVRGAVSYDTPYAVRQHEDMGYRHDGKGRSKWLETTMAEEANTVGQIIVTAIRGELGT